MYRQNRARKKKTIPNSMCSSKKKYKHSKLKCNINCLIVDNIFVVVLQLFLHLLQFKFTKCIHIIWWWWHLYSAIHFSPTLIYYCSSSIHFLTIYSNCTVKLLFFSFLLVAISYSEYCFFFNFDFYQRKKKQNPSRSNTKKMLQFYGYNVIKWA